MFVVVLGQWFVFVDMTHNVVIHINYIVCECLCVHVHTYVCVCVCVCAYIIVLFSHSSGHSWSGSEFACFSL